jgi:hypothetical protein
MVVIAYAPGTPLVTNGAGTTPLILPSEVSRPSDLVTAGAPPRFGDGYWPDSLIIDVGIESAGTRVAGQSISMYLLAVDKGGASIDGEYGHIHNSTMGAVKSPGVLSAARVTTDGSGHSRAVFRPNKISGPVVLVATAAGADSAVDTIRVGVPGLTLLTATPSNDLIGSTGIHPNAYWVTIEMAGKLREFADSFHVETDSLAHFNDASLHYGGKFDLNQQWGTPDATCVFRPRGRPPVTIPTGCHSRHRIGRDVDFRNRDFTVSRFEILAIRLWREIGGLAPIQETDHLHFPYRR